MTNLISREKKIEHKIFTDSWTPGTRTGQNFIGTRTIVNDVLSLSVQEATVEQREIALKILRNKYDINAKVVRSKSMGNIDVIRVENNGPFLEASKFKLAKEIRQPSAWKQNVVTIGGVKYPALNLNVQNAKPEQLEYIQKLMTGWSIPHTVQVSQSLGGVKVLRIQGQENVDKLREALSLLKPDDEPQRPSSPDAKPSNPTLTK